jgi:iron complex outermembrane recepter protein
MKFLKLPSILFCLLAPLTQSYGQTSTTGNATTELEEVVIRADQEKPTNYATENYGGTKLDVPVREVPQAIRVVNRQLIDDTTAVRMQDTFDYVSGVSYQNGFGGLWENYAVRGLTGDSQNFGLSYLLNGFPANRGFNSPRDTASIERIEFLKGPTAALFGSSDPGGTINVVTKKPLWEWRHQLQSLYGSYDFFRQTVDSTGPLTENLAYRFNFAYEDANSFRDFVGSERMFFAPAFTWKITDDTTLEYTGEFLEAEVDFDRGIPMLNRGTAARPRYDIDAVPTNRFFGEPNDPRIKTRNYLNQLRLTHEFNDDWFMRVAMSQKINSLEGFSSETRDVNTAGIMRRRYRYREYDSNDWDIQAELSGKFETGLLKHQMLVGTEVYWFRLDQLLQTGNYGTNLNIFNPIYGQPKPLLSTTNFDRVTVQQGLAFFIQDMISLGDHWRLLAGMRWEDFDQRLETREGGVNRRLTTRGNAWTPRVGLTYLPTDNLSFYTSYSQSFRANQGTDRDRQTFGPERGRAFEVGMKFETDDRRFGGTLAWFDITKKNVLGADPTDPNQVFLVNGGEVHSRGVEMDLNGRITDSLRLSASLTYQHAQVVNSESFAEGATLLNSPRFSANFLAIQEFDLGRAGKLGVGAGVIYMGERNGRDITPANRNGADLPDYTTVKALAYWQVNERMRLTLDVDNLFDKTYYQASINQNVVQPGAPRTITAGVQVTF